MATSHCCRRVKVAAPGFHFFWVFLLLGLLGVSGSSAAHEHPAINARTAPAPTSVLAGKTRRLRAPASAWTSLENFATSGVFSRDDPLSQLQPAAMEQLLAAQDQPAVALPAVAAESFLETGQQLRKVDGFCEVCIHIVQNHQRQEPHLCAGLHPDYFNTCVKNLESLLHTDKVVSS